MTDKCDSCSKWALRCELNGTMRKECQSHGYQLFRAKSAQRTKLPDDTYYKLETALKEFVKPIYDCLLAHLESHIAIASGRAENKNIRQVILDFDKSILDQIKFLKVKGKGDT